MNKNTNLRKWLPRLAAIIGILLMVLAFSSNANAQGGSACDQDPNCVKIDDPGNSGTYTAPGTIVDFVIKAGTVEHHYAPPGPHDDGCYTVSFSTVNVTNDTVTYNKYGSGPTCKDVSHIQMWWTEGEPQLYPAAVVKFHDMNENGVQDNGEPRLGGWVYNWTASDGQSGQLTTDGNGYAQTGNIFADGVTVTFTEVVQNGWHVTTANPAGVTVVTNETATAYFGNNQDDTPNEGTLTGDPNCAVLTVTSSYPQPVTAEVYIDNMDTPAWTGQINPGTTPFTLNFTDDMVHSIKLRWADPDEGWKELSWNVGPCGDTSCGDTFDTIHVYAQWVKTGLPVRDVTITDYRDGAAGTPVLTSKDQGHVTYWVEEDTEFNIKAELIDPADEPGLWDGYSIVLIQSPDGLPLHTNRCHERVIYVLVDEPGPETNCEGPGCVRLNVEVALEMGLTTGFHESGRLDVYEELQHADGRIETGRWIASVRVQPGWEDMTFVLPHWVTGPTNVQVYWVPDSTGESLLLEIVNGNWVDPGMEHALEIVPPAPSAVANGESDGGVLAALAGTMATLAVGFVKIRGGFFAI